MSLRDTIADIRFGYGRRPGDPAPGSADAMLEGVGRADAAETRFVGATTALRRERLGARRNARLALRDKSGSQADEKRAEADLRRQALDDVLVTFQRAIDTRSGFRERLVAF